MMEREGSVVVMAMTVVVMVLCVIVNDVTAKPPAVTTQPVEANHVEDQYLDDALGEWLDEFGTYTFMVKQDLDTHAGDDDEGGEGLQVDVDAAINEVDGEVEGEEVVEEVEEEWSAPIAVSTGSKSLLDPRHDYLVTVESLVAEEGSIFVTLSRYDNQTKCGVGGLYLEEEVRGAAGQGSDGDNTNNPTSYLAFGLLQEGNTSADVSKWIEVSRQYWWASGQLAGGGMLSISFTPPECGCLALSTYFALPVGNLTLVVGPQAYPEELQSLLCIDPLAGVSSHAYEEEEEEETGTREEEEEQVDYLQQPSALVASRNPAEDEAETETETETETEAEESPDQPTVTSRKRKMSREEKKMAKKTRRQMKRQRIRQAGRRQARRQGQAGGGRRAGRRWSRKKNQRKRTKVWKKLQKRGRKARRRNHHHHHQDVNGTDTENVTHHHHPHHHHAAHALNTTSQEERLVDILLRDVSAENTTLEDEVDEEGAMGESEGTGEAAEGEEGEQTPRQRRKNRRQRKKMMRKQRRKVYPPGVKFCCKQGVKHKKNILEIDSSSEASSVSCNSSISVVSTFANHQFGIEEDACTTTFTTCCHRFTAEMWDGIKAKKEARRTERKQRRKSRRQGRKLRRKQERRLRKGMKRQSHAHAHAHEEQEGQ